MSHRYITFATSLALVGSVAACSSAEKDVAGDSAAAGSSAAAPPVAGAMTGTHAMGGTHSDTLVTRVQAHLQQLSTSDPSSLQALLPANRQIVTALIADCEQMMRQMKMEPPQKWRSAVQDLRQDLDRMATMSGAELARAIPDHRKRVEGMLAMRHDMMEM